MNSKVPTIEEIEEMIKKEKDLTPEKMEEILALRYQHPEYMGKWDDLAEDIEEASEMVDIDFAILLATVQICNFSKPQHLSALRYCLEIIPNFSPEEAEKFELSIKQ